MKKTNEPMRTPVEKAMVAEAAWDEFRSSGLLWWVNRMLHVFGWAIIVEMNDDDTHVRRAFPARCRFRGFETKLEEDGFRKLTKHFTDEGDRLLEETK